MLQYKRISLIYYELTGILFLFFTPIQLKLRVKKYIKSIAEYQTPKEYTYTKEGIFVVQGDYQKFSREYIRQAEKAQVSLVIAK